MVPRHRIPRLRFNPSADFPRAEVMLRSACRPPSPEEIYFDALLYNRLMAIRESRGVWARIRRFLWGA
jgi:hypothetical protein